MLWDLAEGKRLYSLDAGDIIYALCFSPNRYWLCAATQSCVKIWDLESKSIVGELHPDSPRRQKSLPPSAPLSSGPPTVAPSSGYTDCMIRVWTVNRSVGPPAASTKFEARWRPAIGYEMGCRI